MTLGGVGMAKEWRMGDKVRNKETGEVVTVREYMPSGYLSYEQGFTYMDDNDGVGGWAYIDEYELVERADNVTKTNDRIIKMTLNDGTVIEGTAEEVAKLQRLISEGGPVNDEYEIIGRGDTCEREMSFLRAGREIGDVKAGDIISTKFYGLLEVIDFSEKAIHPVSVTINGVEDGLQVEACTLVCPVEKRTDLA